MIVQASNSHCLTQLFLRRNIMARTTKIDPKQLVVMAGNLSRTIGESEAGIFGLQESTEKAVEKQLVELRNAGFTVEMLKPKHDCRIAMEKELLIAYVRGRSPEYAAYFKETVAAKQAPELPDAHWFEARKLPTIKVPDSTRYNRFSAIKQWFETNTGKKSAPLDLYGNAARKAAADNAKKGTGKTATNTNAKASSEATKAVENKVQPQLKGVAPLHKFLQAWIAENESVAGLQKYSKVCAELVRAIEQDLPKK